MRNDELVRRIGYAVRELGVPFPELCDEPGDQWQVHEAVMLRYSLLLEESESLEDARARARAQADEWVQERKRMG